MNAILPLRVPTLLTMFAALLVGPEAAAALPPKALIAKCEVRLARGLLSVDVVATPLRDVIARVAHVAGAKVTWLVNDGREETSLELRGLPLVEGIARILAGRNRAIATSGAAQPAVLHIWVGSRSASAGTLQPNDEGSLTTGAFASTVWDGSASDVDGAEVSTETLAESARVAGEIAVSSDARELAALLADDERVDVRVAAMQRLDQIGALPGDTLASLALDGSDGHLRHQAIELLSARVADDPSAPAVLAEITETAALPFLREIAAEKLASGSQ